MRKTIAAILLVAVLGATSCKKEEQKAPTLRSFKIGRPGSGLEKSNVGSWD